MYWIPAIFILVEMLYLFYIDKMISYVNATALYKKYKDDNLVSYIKNIHNDSMFIYFTIGIFIFLEVIYFIIGLFFPFWFVSIVFLCYYIILILMDKFESPSTSKMIKLANLKNFSTTDIKFDRLLKLNEINQRDVKIHKLKIYSYPILKIIIFAIIIITHYNPTNIIKSGNRIGFYTDSTLLIDKNKKPLCTYNYTINIQMECQKYN